MREKPKTSAAALAISMDLKQMVVSVGEHGPAREAHKAPEPNKAKQLGYDQKAGE